MYFPVVGIVYPSKRVLIHLDHVLAPYSQALEVEPYKVECSCANNIGRFKPLCQMCNGTGVAYSSHNPESKFDSFVIGGRWSGALDGVHSDCFVDNFHKCELCDGEDHTNSCPRCKGRGIVACWSVNPWEGDSGLITDCILDTTFLPSVVVTRDGWEELWSADHPIGRQRCALLDVFHRILAEWSGHLAVLLDCHI